MAGSFAHCSHFLDAITPERNQKTISKRDSHKGVKIQAEYLARSRKEDREDGTWERACATYSDTLAHLTTLNFPVSVVKSYKLNYLSIVLSVYTCISWHPGIRSFHDSSQTDNVVCAAPTSSCA